MRFIADPKANFSTQSYGLKEVALPERQTATESITPTPPSHSVPVPPPITPPPVKESYVSENSNINAPQDDYIPEPVPKQTVGEVLSSNVEPESQYLDEEDFEYEEEKSGSGLLRWLLPLIALLLVFGLIFQLKKNDSNLRNIPPFSFFMGDDDDDVVIADKQDVRNNEEKVIDDRSEDYRVDDQDENTAKTDQELDEEAEALRMKEENRREIAELEAKEADRKRQAAAAAEAARTQQNNSTTNSGSVSSGSSTEVYYQNEIPKGHYGVVGVFGEKKNAQKMARKMKDQGRDVYMVKSGNRFRALIFLAGSESEAEFGLRDLKQNVNKDAWLLKN